MTRQSSMKHHPKILAVVLSILLLLWNDIKNGKSRRAIPLFVVDATEEVILDHQGNLKSTPSKKGGGEDDALECGVWLAPSTLEGAGIGMFAGRDFDLGQEMIAGGDSIVPISDITEHNVGKIYPGNFLWQEYVWGVDAVNNREGLSEISTASPGFGSAANSNLPLQNVDMQFPKRTPNGLHRSSHAGAGASTIFHHRTSTARHAIATGDELYVSYGENWFTQRPYLGLIPLTNDLNIATRLLRKFTALQTLLKRKGVGTEIAELVWTRFVRDTQFRDSRVLLGAFRHDDPTDLETLQKVYNSNVTDGRMAASRRSVEWLREFGTCGDHIVGGNQSTLPEAGLGAFASRRLPKGTIVAQLPMIHIPDRRRLQMHKLFQNSEGHWVPENGIVTGHQLLLNYCYGHPQSTMVLCPYGPVTNYLNHNQTLANVRLQWSKASKGNHMPELLDTSVDEIASSDATAKLAMELVALREIQAGEEVFLDYGDEWEAAWTNHVKRWKPVSGAAQYQSAVQLDADHSTRLRTVFEDVDAQSKGKSWMNSFTTSTTTKSMYPDNVELLCDTTCQREPDQMQSHYLNGTLEKYLYESNSEWWPCSVLKYRLDEDNNGEYLYKIHLHQPDSGGFLIDNVPRSIFHFVDKPITSDVFLPNAFRHAIGIPDEMFPEKWRNIQK